MKTDQNRENLQPEQEQVYFKVAGTNSELCLKFLPFLLFLITNENSSAAQGGNDVKDLLD